MLKLAILVRRNPALTRQQFREYLSTHHAALVRACPASSVYVRRYVQSFVQPDEHRSHDGSAVRYDALVELWFDDLQQMQTFYTDPDYVANVKPDEPNFADIANCSFIITEENRVL